MMIITVTRLVTHWGVWVCRLCCAALDRPASSPTSRPHSSLVGRGHQVTVHPPSLPGCCLAASYLCTHKEACLSDEKLNNFTIRYRESQLWNDRIKRFTSCLHCDLRWIKLRVYLCSLILLLFYFLCKGLSYLAMLIKIVIVHSFLLSCIYIYYNKG